MLRKKKIPSDTIGDRSLDRLVAQRLNHSPTLGPLHLLSIDIFHCLADANYVGGQLVDVAFLT